MSSPAKAGSVSYRTMSIAREPAARKRARRAIASPTLSLHAVQRHSPLCLPARGPHPAGDLHQRQALCLFRGAGAALSKDAIGVLQRRIFQRAYSRTLPLCARRVIGGNIPAGDESCLSGVLTPPPPKGK